MRDERLRPRVENIEPVSPSRTLLGSSDRLYFPGEKFSPETLHAKPWPIRPQRLYKAGEGFKWWDTTVDFVMILLPFPFFLLAAAVISVNGKKVDHRELELLEACIKGVSNSCYVPDYLKPS